jgi:hypothetical protein
MMRYLFWSLSVDWLREVSPSLVAIIATAAKMFQPDTAPSDLLLL